MVLEKAEPLEQMGLAQEDSRAGYLPQQCYWVMEIVREPQLVPDTERF